MPNVSDTNLINIGIFQQAAPFMGGIFSGGIFYSILVRELMRACCRDQRLSLLTMRIKTEVLMKCVSYLALAKAGSDKFDLGR